MQGLDNELSLVKQPPLLLWPTDGHQVVYCNPPQSWSDSVVGEVCVGPGTITPCHTLASGLLCGSWE
jgi:hypothetical protein